MYILFYCRWMYILFVHNIFNNNAVALLDNYWDFINSILFLQ